MPLFVVIDIDGGDALSGHDTKEAALAYVGRLLATNGRGYAADLEIVRVTPEGRYVDATGGNELLAALDDQSEGDWRRAVAPSAGGFGGGLAVAASPASG